MNNIYFLPKKLIISPKTKDKIEKDYKHFAVNWPENVEQYILNEYNVDISASYGFKKIKNPFGKASGQLSSNIRQIENDIGSGLGFVVLKTVIAEDEAGHSGMQPWKRYAPRMKVEKIESKLGKKGWTVTWKGRGWSKSFNDYLEFMEKSLQKGKEKGVPVVPSCQYHLPEIKGTFNEKEYQYTTNLLLSTWKKIYPDSPLLLEQDFSPTLLDGTLQNKEQIFYWLDNVLAMIKSCVNERELLLGLKLLNAPFADEFQVEMLEYLLINSIPVDWVICFNRLFNPNKTFMKKKGIAYGGYDLSDRNLRVLTRFRKLEKERGLNDRDFPISATGNINSGKMMVEYALRGCKNGQIHTFFQLPTNQYRMERGMRTLKALHELLFNPEDGLVITLAYLDEYYGLTNDNIIKFNDITNLYREMDIWRLFK